MEPNIPPTTPLAQSSKRISGRTKLALWLMIAPAALLIVSFIGFAIVNFVFGNTVSDNTAGCSTSQQGIEGDIRDSTLENKSDEPCELFAPQPPFIPIVNVLLFLIGAVSVMSFLPGLITGIVLLATKPKQTI